MNFFSWLHYTWDYRIGWRNQYVEIRCVGFRLFGKEFDHFEIAWTDGDRECRQRVSKLEESHWTQITDYKKRTEQ